MCAHTVVYNGVYVVCAWVGHHCITRGCRPHCVASGFKGHACIVCAQRGRAWERGYTLCTIMKYDQSLLHGHILTFFVLLWQVCASVDNQVMVYPARQRGAILLKVSYIIRVESENPGPRCDVCAGSNMS